MAVSIQQASTNAFVTYLRTVVPGVSIESRWPEKGFPGKAITVLPAGSRKDTMIEPRLLSATNSGSTNTLARWQVAACYQPYQLDVWATSNPARDDIMAQLDIELKAGLKPLGIHRMPFGYGASIAVQDGWQAFQTTARFVFDSPSVDDTPDTVGRRQFRAIYRGGCNVMLSLATTTPRQKFLSLSLLLDGSTDPDEYLA